MVVSQDTALFEGTLRENIDPLCVQTDDAVLMSILKRLAFTNQSFETHGLEMQIDSDGGNLSQGEKQLICFSRTLVSKRTLIILDEATANIDIKTEESIQKAVEEEFENSTMLIIAHRIQTVLHCDRIIVLRDGKIEEMGVVKEMIRKEGSYLKEIYDKLIKK
jgi:ATP-binding cassette subfamily C (CFTR/MRP) protein 1